jgi:hypothetical protein
MPVSFLGVSVPILSGSILNIRPLKPTCGILDRSILLGGEMYRGTREPSASAMSDVESEFHVHVRT